MRAKRRFEEVVARGVAFLDAKEPGWLDRIDPDKIKMLEGGIDKHRCGCVGALLHGYYYSAIYRWCGAPSEVCNLDTYDKFGDEFGFSLSWPENRGPGWNELTREWQRQIRERKAVKP